MYKMVTLCSHIVRVWGKTALFWMNVRFATAFDLNKCLNQIKLPITPHTCAIFELPANISTLGNIEGIYKKNRNTWDDSSWQFLSFFDLWLCFSLATECWRSRTVGQIEIGGKTCTPLTPRVHSGLTWLAHRLWSVKWHHRQWRPVIPL